MTQDKNPVKLSIVILCWNSQKVLPDCLESLFSRTVPFPFEVIVADNDSSDDTVAFTRKNYPKAIVVQNGGNLGFSAGNNGGFRVARGEYVFILNPDTIIHEGTLEKLIQFADAHPEAGAFGCQVVNPDGSPQQSARPFPTPLRCWLSALYLRPLGYLSSLFTCDTYLKWDGRTEREIDWTSGCSLLVRGEILKRVGGFDEQFFYHFDEVDLCRRIWNLGCSILYTPEPVLTHLGGNKPGILPLSLEIEKNRNRYRYFFKHFGIQGASSVRRALLVSTLIRYLGYGVVALGGFRKGLQPRIKIYRGMWHWNRRLNLKAFFVDGTEPAGVSPLKNSDSKKGCDTDHQVTKRRVS